MSFSNVSFPEPLHWTHCCCCAFNNVHRHNIYNSPKKHTSIDWLSPLCYMGRAVCVKAASLTFFCPFCIAVWFFSPFWDLGVLREKLRFRAPSKKKPTQDLEKRTNTFYDYSIQTTNNFIVLVLPPANFSWKLDFYPEIIWFGKPFNICSQTCRLHNDFLFFSPEPISICSYSTLGITKVFLCFVNVVFKIYQKRVINYIIFKNIFIIVFFKRMFFQFCIVKVENLPTLRPLNCTAYNYFVIWELPRMIKNNI